MKSGIHPEYQQSNVHCACGHTFQTRSAVPDIHVDVCAACHPFYTGRQKLMDTAGRVERFRRKWGGQEDQGEQEETEEQAEPEAQAKPEEESEPEAQATSGDEAETEEEEE